MLEIFLCLLSSSLLSRYEERDASVGVSGSHMFLLERKDKHTYKWYPNGWWMISFLTYILVSGHTVCFLWISSLFVSFKGTIALRGIFLTLVWWYLLPRGEVLWILMVMDATVALVVKVHRLMVLIGMLRRFRRRFLIINLVTFYSWFWSFCVDVVRCMILVTQI